MEKGGPVRGKGRSASKADLKRGQLPVTESTPYVCAPIPAGDFPDVVPVLDPLGGFLFWADEELARRLIASRQVTFFRTKKKKVRALMATGPLDEADSAPRSRRRQFGLPHCKETNTNPPRVWTQDRMGNTTARPDRLMPTDDSIARWCRKVCITVLTSCTTTKKAA